MRCIAFDSKDFRRLKKTADGNEGGFFTPLGVGVVFDNPDEFTKAYIKATAEISEEFGIESPNCIYSSSMLKDE